MRATVRRQLRSLFLIAMGVLPSIDAFAAAPDARMPADLAAAVRTIVAANGGGAQPPGWLEQEVTPDDSAQGDQFGISVAIEGDTALIGASYENSGQGAAYVFTQAGGVWTQTQKLTASDGMPNDWFGESVALDGDTAVIGGSQYLNFGNGVAYVFTRSDGTWSEAQKLTADDGTGRDQFGISVAIAKSTVLVGAYGVAFYQGAAYVFTGSGGSWTQSQKLVASDASQNADFGVSVALDGSNALIGAYGDASYQGAGYVFTNASGTWTESQKLVADDGAANDHLGISVALDGDTALLGAEGAMLGKNSHQGAAYVFTASNDVWSQAQKLTSDDGAAFDFFGRSVSIEGTNAIIGAYGPNASQGAAYVFANAGGGWTQAQELVASDAAQGDQFGIWVALSGADILVGADGAAAFAGHAYFYTMPGASDDAIFADGFDP